MKKYLKNTGGITLISLVITIIILLILAAISIQALTNQRLFGKASEAKEKSEIANIKEQIALDIYEKQLEPPLGTITDEQLETILEKHGTVNKEDGKIVGIKTGKGYEILLKDIYGGETVAESVPDGATVTPVNDITTWLKTGEISKQYSYTTIEQVIADSTCTESLMNNENAMKYLARSTEFADVICVNETAMTYLGQSVYVDDTVLNSDLWISAICNSEHFELVLNVKVPTMTSNTEPYGEAISNSPQAPLLDSWKAFDGSVNSSSTTYDWWIGKLWLGYKFVSPTKVNKFVYTSKNDGNGKSDFIIKLQASNDGNSYVDLTENLQISGANVTGVEFTFDIINYDYYLYYRIYFVEPSQTDNTWSGCNELQFYGRM